MYIEISRELSENIQNSEVTDILRLAADTMREGRHWVWTEDCNSALRITNEIKDSDKRTASFFLSIYDKFSEFAKIKSEVSLYLSVVLGDKVVKEGKCIKVGHKIALNSHFWQQALFVVENSDDAEIYRAITKTLKEKVNLSFEVESGGGDATHKAIENKLKQNYIVFTIVDSDKKSPDSDFGSTAKHILENQFIQTHLLHELLVLNVCELENIFFSKSIWRDFMTETQACKISKIVEEAEEKDSNIRCFLDVKSGMSYKQFNLNDYMKNTIAVEIPNCVIRSQHDDKCQKCKKCECMVVSGVGRYTKKLVEDNNFVNKMQDYYNELPSLITKDWDNIAKIMSTWAFGAKIQATECR